MTKKDLNENQLQLDDYGYEGSLAAKACVQRIMARTAQIEFAAGLVLSDEQHHMIITVKFARQPVCYYTSKLQGTDLSLLESAEKKKRTSFVSDHIRMAEQRFYKALSEWVDMRCTMDYPDLPYQYEFKDQPSPFDL